MEIEEFAQNVLLTPTLAAKLEMPAGLTDRQPGPGGWYGARPARPAGLTARPGQERVKLPGG